MRHALAGLVLLVALACTEPSAPEPSLAGAGADKVGIAWSCVDLTCTFTQVATNGINIQRDVWWPYTADANGNRQYSLTDADGNAIFAAGVNPWIFTFPAPGRYVVELTAFTRSKGYIVDSLVTVP